MAIRAVTRQPMRGHSLIEVVVLVMVLGALLTFCLPGLAALQRAAALRAATQRLNGLMVRCRALALMRGRASSLVFERTAGSGWRCFIAEDGDGDGVRRDDLDRGRDRILGEVLQLENGTAGLGILDGRVPDPAGRGWLDGNPDDPVRAGRGDIITFTPSSTATPSSVYLTDYHSRMRVLRVYGGTARVYQLTWSRGWSSWRRSGL